MRVKELTLVLACLCTCLGGCDSSELSPTKTLRKPLGNVEYAVGEERHTAPFGGVSCLREKGREVMILQSNQQISINQVPRVPDLLRLEIGDAEQAFTAQNDAYAVAYLPNAVLQGNEYPMVMFVAQNVEGVTDYSCELKRVEKSRELTCQNVLVLPWRQPTTRPVSAFKATFACP